MHIVFQSNIAAHRHPSIRNQLHDFSLFFSKLWPEMSFVFECINRRKLNIIVGQFRLLKTSSIILYHQLGQCCIFIYPIHFLCIALSLVIDDSFYRHRKQWLNSCFISEAWLEWMIGSCSQILIASFFYPNWNGWISQPWLIGFFTELLAFL